MYIHEYQAKDLFKKYHIPVPNGGVAFNADQAVGIAEKLNACPIAVKAQVHAGGRGKGGGIRLAKSIDEVRKFTNEIIGMTLVTHQMGEEGRVVKKALIESGLNIKKEYYISIIIDRASAKIVLMASEAGGMDIEEIASSTPEKIIRISIDPLVGLQPFHCRELAFRLRLKPGPMKLFIPIVTNLYNLFINYDCSLIEINPLVITSEDEIIALDGKINLDDNSLFRHKDIAEYRDIEEEDPLEIEASRYNLNYIKLKGNVGNMVNGAGLAMATMDLIKQAGAEPANFLDIGGGASEEMVEKGFKIILSDKSVNCILINIFGGILRCDVLAKGIVQAAKNTGIKIPVIIRMEGTNVDQGRRLLNESSLNLITAENIKDAAEKVAQAVKTIKK